MKGHAAQIVCTECGQEALLLREPLYEGVRKVGETLKCSACAHEFAEEADIPYKDVGKPNLFADSDRPKPPVLFDAGTIKRICRHCARYVVNPFVQRCGRTQRDVEATDTCDAFEDKQEEPDE